MLKDFSNVPVPVNEPVNVWLWEAQSERKWKAALEEARSKQIDVQLYIGRMK